MTSRQFVIPDIHGCAFTFRRLLHEVIHIRRSDSLYLLGDTIDRGPRSKEVLDTILKLRGEGFRILSLRGNHEDMLLRSCHDRTFFHLWMLNGGQETLASFNVEDSCEIPHLYRTVMASWPYFIKLPEFILVHAGLNFLAADPFADTEAMLWSRDINVDKKRIGGRRLIGGHTPVSADEIRKSLASDRVMLDNGCIYRDEPGLGSLAALELNSMALHFQKNIDL